MLTFTQYITLEEGNILQQRVNKHISKGVSIGAVSPEGAHTSTDEEKENAHANIKKHLEDARKSGHIGGWSGPHDGQYQYGGHHEVSLEKSYVVHAAGSSDEHHKKMVSALSDIGNKHKQESVMSANKDKRVKWHYLKHSDSPGKEVDKGKLAYNKPLERGTGRTQMKKSKHSFTSVE